MEDSHEIWLRHTWGEIKVGPLDRPTIHKDSILSNRQSFEWDWREDGTTHNRPGFQRATLEAWLARYPGTKVVVLTRGVDRVLQIAFDVDEFQRQHPGIEVIVQDTVQAVATYNRLLREKGSQGVSLLGFFHSTC